MYFSERLDIARWILACVSLRRPSVWGGESVKQSFISLTSEPRGRPNYTYWKVATRLTEFIFYTDHQPISLEKESLAFKKILSPHS